MSKPPHLPQTPDQMMHAIQVLTGEVHALFMFCQAAAQSHPNPPSLLLSLQDARQHGLAYLEAQPVSDAVLAGYQDTMSAIRKLIAAPGAAPPSMGA